MERNLRKERIGQVVSNKMEKTITIAVEKKVKHLNMGSSFLLQRNLLSHDENNECGVGDTVKIMETRPLSKNKRWRLVEVLEKAK